MKDFRKFLRFGCVPLVAFAVAGTAIAADNLQPVLSKLDESSKTFSSAEADIVWEGTQVNPVPDTDTQSGTVVFARSGGQMRVAVHIKADNGKPYQKDMVYADGVGKLYEPAIKQLQVFQVGNRRDQLNSFLTLGFGGSGADLEKNWNVQSQGVEAVNGVQAAKLLLTPKDAALTKSTPKVLLWIDTARGVAVKQQRYDSDGNYLTFTYNHIRLNGKVPGDTFEIKTASGTQTVNHSGSN
ncbi:outer membrane lipoprotein carrier protein LolA [Acidicapsa dinghuensis]|uniref:Outer membrane lipoprotein carrier protein LolA n=1 Tax=Acidicapsa dinghuensis TaxID=2218256 RepID=A0ABW1EF14_9BACT